MLPQCQWKIARGKFRCYVTSLSGIFASLALQPSKTSCKTAFPKPLQTSRELVSSCGLLQATNLRRPSVRFVFAFFVFVTDFRRSHWPQYEPHCKRVQHYRGPRRPIRATCLRSARTCCRGVFPRERHLGWRSTSCSSVKCRLDEWSPSCERWAPTQNANGHVVNSWTEQRGTTWWICIGH